MNDLELQINDLTDMIKNTHEHIEYHKLLSSIKEDSDLYKRLNEFRKQSFILNFQNHDNLLIALEQLRQQYNDILQKEAVSQFLQAEQQLTKTARQINTSVTNALNLDIDFLNE